MDCVRLAPIWDRGDPETCYLADPKMDLPPLHPELECTPWSGQV